MCSKNTWGEVGVLNHPGWQHMIFFEREHGIQSPLLIIIIILCLQAAVAASEGVIAIRMWTKNTWGERNSALNHSVWQHIIFFLNTEFSLSPKNKGKVLGTNGRCQSRTALLRWVTWIYRLNTQKQGRQMSLPEICSVLSGPFTSHRVS